MGASTVSKHVMRVCQAIIRVLAAKVMPAPTTEMWLQQARLFEERWQFPHCISSVDGKHVEIVSPRNSGSMYHNYKHTKSVVLMAVVDADYRFVCVDIGAYGKNSDGGIFERSTMGQKFANGQMNVPAPAELPGTNVVAPYTLVGDEAFALSDYMLRPYPRSSSDPDGSKRAFNFRLSRARRIVENAFGILAERWRIYMRPIELAPTKVNVIVMATILLHNFLTPSSFHFDHPPNCSVGGLGSLPRPQRIRNTN